MTELEKKVLHVAAAIWLEDCLLIPGAESSKEADFAFVSQLTKHLYKNRAIAALIAADKFDGKL